MSWVTPATAVLAQQAQEPNKIDLPIFKPTPNDTVVSPEVVPDKRVTFRVYAPQAKSVAVSGEWVFAPRALQGIELQPSNKRTWSVTAGPLPPGAYRYHFLLDGAQISDRRNPSVSEGHSDAQSMFVVPGLDYGDTKHVPHGSVWHRLVSIHYEFAPRLFR